MSAEELNRSASLFTREGESVFIQVQQDGPVWRLQVFGPGSATAAHEFREHQALLAFHASFEQELTGRGFALQAVAERRRDGDQEEAAPRNREDRRRQR